ncbi:DUF928 domain-containing protein [Microcoleus sp. FACHB-SPT15]|uniref:DUF928 domain-containing protein n=1 Tax=Microcoleus sp. FACHB-SPT15 TaxID=2692830 RepID=UPI001780DBE5|nr:DUF928 domain-containing protein [Microcoleus sp. FACHB-SPT15]MBD1805573.1 DUF928 domain-containing protein [Microcoleus sp. FACHB-SPT15]
MAWFKRSSRFIILTTLLAVSLAIGIAVNTPAQIQPQLRTDSISGKLPTEWENTFTPPTSGPPPVNRLGGATRSPKPCITDTGSLIALVPESGFGETMAEYPTVFWYMPKTVASQLDFVLRDANQEEIYSTTYTLAKSADNTVVGSPGIMSLSLPAFANLPPLKLNQEYFWTLALVCSPTNRDIDIFAGGGIKRVQPDPTFARRVQQATPQERIALYANKRLWYETLATLVELQRDRPNSYDLTNAFNKLLTSVGLQGLPSQQVN